jgi:anti-sigma B factor antagonist
MLVVLLADFSRKATKVGDVHVVALRGEMDMATVGDLSDWLVEIAGSSVVVDLSQVAFMDSSGIAALVQARNRMAEDGNELILTRPIPMVKRILEIVALTGWVQNWNSQWGPD